MTKKIPLLVKKAQVYLEGKLRVAIETLYNNPEIIVLDEATNSLDKGLEKNILDMLKDLKKTLIIS